MLVRYTNGVATIDPQYVFCSIYTNVNDHNFLTSPLSEDHEKAATDPKTVDNQRVLNLLGTRDRSHIQDALKLSEPGDSESKW